MALTQSQAKLQTGDTAPDFQLQGIDEKMYSLADFSGHKGLLIIFMCNHCPYVHAKMDAILALYEKFQESVPVIGINSNEPEYPGEGMENMKKFATEKGITFSYLLDDSQEVAKAYGATCTPDPFLFDKEMKLVFHGRLNDAMEPGDKITENTMEDVIQDMLNEKGIDPEFKPSLGCSIKWLE